MNYLVLNICLCYDLISVIKDPFASKEKRVTRYIIISLFLGSVNGILFMNTNEGGSIFFAVVMSIYCIVAAWSIIFCAYRLYYSGLSKQTRRLVLTRHVFWILSFLVTNVYILYLNILVILFDFGDSDKVRDRVIHQDDSLFYSWYKYFYDG